MLPALNKISTFQYAPTQDKMDKYKQVLDYASTHPNATIRYNANTMILATDTDAVYLVIPEYHSRISGYYYFTNRMIDYYKVTTTPNRTILIEYKTLKTVVSSSYKAETGGTFENTQNVIPLRHILEKVYLHQQPTKGSPIITENLTSQGILTRFIKPCKSKTWDIGYHWIEDLIYQKHIQLIRKRGIHNWDDYFTKHHPPPAYHQSMRTEYIIHCLTHSTFL